MNGLPPETVAAIGGVFARHPEVDKALLYGSRAKGNYKRGSNIDLILLGARLDLRDLMHLADELDDLLLPYTIDLSLHSQLENPALLDHIERVGKVFYQAEPEVAIRQ